MLKISRQEINDVIKSARHPNAGKLSHDYALPLPERQFGEPLKSGKAKRWMFDGMPTGGKSDLQAWIDRSKRYDDMKIIQPLTLIEQKKEEIQKGKKDESKKVQLLEKLLNRLGIAAPAGAPVVATVVAPARVVAAPARVVAAPGPSLVPAPASIMVPAVAAPTALTRAAAARSPPRARSPGPLGRVLSFSDVIDEEFGKYSARAESPGTGRRIGGVATPERRPPSVPRERIPNQSQVQVPIATFDERTAPQGTLPNISGSGLVPAPEPELAPEITEIPTVVDWDNKKLRSDIAVVLRDEYNYKGGTANVEKIIEWYKQNPQFVPKFFSVSNVKDSFTTSKIPLGKLGLTKK